MQLLIVRQYYPVMQKKKKKFIHLSPDEIWGEENRLAEETKKDWPERDEENLKNMVLQKKAFQGKEGVFPVFNVVKERSHMVTEIGLLEFTGRKVSDDNEILTEVQVEEEAR